MPRDSEIKIAQGWIYSGINNGQPHRAIDYFRGESPADHRDWKTFAVVAAADGKACEKSFITTIGTFRFGVNHSVEIDHDNGFTTRYLHLDPDSLSKRRVSFPDCAGHERLEIKRGDKIGDAGDSGTYEGWIHLDFRVKDEEGHAIDPYDLYLQNRRLYPDLLLTNGRYCGPDALFFEEICPRASVLGIRITAESPATPVAVETPTRQEAIANLGNWQLAVVDWQESEYQYFEHGMYGDPQKNYRSGWKYVTASTRLRNTGEPIYFNGESARGRNLYDIYVTTPQFPQEKYIGERQFDPVEFQVPVGFSYPKEFGFWIPENVSDYSLVVADLRGRDTRKIERGKRAQNFEWIDSSVDFMNPGETWRIPGRMSAKFNRVFVYECPSPTCIFYQEQYASFEVTNESGQDIKTGYAFGTGFEMKMF